MEPYTHRGNTPIYVVKDHNEVIVPWGEFRFQCEEAPFLITFDSHTDTLPAFFRWAYHKHEDRMGSTNWIDDAQRRVKALSYASKTSLLDAAEDLKHDEHIQASLDSGIISQAHVFAYGKVGAAHSKVNYLNINCLPDCKLRYHDDECSRSMRDYALEDKLLDEVFQEVKVSSDLESDKPLILDVDLDYLTTVFASKPKFSTQFYELLDRASVITIAKEPSCVENCRLDDSVTSESNLKNLLKIIV